MSDIYLTKTQAEQLVQNLKDDSPFQVTIQETYRLMDIRERQLHEGEELLSWQQTRQEVIDNLDLLGRIENNLVDHLSGNDFEDYQINQISYLIGIVTEGTITLTQAEDLAKLIVRL